MFRKGFLGWSTLSIALACVDQCTKYWVINALTPGETSSDGGLVTISLHYNPGIGFSLFTHFPSLLVSIVSCIVLYIFYQLYRAVEMRDTYATKIGLSCILGGGLGNLYDRVQWGAVVDFIRINLPPCPPGILNIADILISLGFILLLVKGASLTKKIG